MPTERSLGRPLGIDMDPLVIVGGVGEQIDAVLGDLQPLRRTELPALRRDELVQTAELFTTSPPL